MNNGPESTPRPEPNTELLRVQGWSVISTFGPYCTAWKGNDERLFIWQDGQWQHLAGSAGLVG